MSVLEFVTRYMGIETLVIRFFFILYSFVTRYMGIETKSSKSSSGFSTRFVTRYMGIETDFIYCDTDSVKCNLLLAIWVLKHSKLSFGK